LSYTPPLVGVFFFVFCVFFFVGGFFFTGLLCTTPSLVPRALRQLVPLHCSPGHRQQQGPDAFPLPKLFSREVALPFLSFTAFPPAFPTSPSRFPSEFPSSLPSGSVFFRPYFSLTAYNNFSIFSPLPSLWPASRVRRSFFPSSQPPFFGHLPPLLRHPPFLPLKTRLVAFPRAKDSYSDAFFIPSPIFFGSPKSRHTFPFFPPLTPSLHGLPLPFSALLSDRTNSPRFLQSLTGRPPLQFPPTILTRQGPSPVSFFFSHALSLQ